MANDDGVDIEGDEDLYSIELSDEGRATRKEEAEQVVEHLSGREGVWGVKTDDGTGVPTANITYEGNNYDLTIFGGNDESDEPPSVKITKTRAGKEARLPEAYGGDLADLAENVYDTIVEDASESAGSEAESSEEGLVETTARYLSDRDDLWGVRVSQHPDDRRVTLTYDGTKYTVETMGEEHLSATVREEVEIGGRNKMMPGGTVFGDNPEELVENVYDTIVREEEDIDEF